MRLLVVEGNTKETRQQREAMGGISYHKRFESMLNILRPEADVFFAFPSDTDNHLPSVNQLQAFQGVLWTGSSLHVNDSSPAVKRQLMFAEKVFKSAVPFYGSCWGLQIAVVVAGGQVATCGRGRELGITQPIVLSDSGKQHVYFSGRTDRYRALCMHLDEIVKVPKDATVLARNDHSEIQALTIRYGDSEFFGVQYHPEFLVSDLVFIINQMAPSLIAEGVFDSKEEVESFISNLDDQNNLPIEISNYLLHIQEINGWLNHAVDGVGERSYAQHKTYKQT